MIAIFPAISACAASGDVEKLGVLVREYFAGDNKFAPQLSVEPMLKHMGIPVSRIALDGIGALVAKDQNGRFEITAVINPHSSACHERFLLAHLLGHYLLHVQPFIARGDWLLSGFRETQCAMDRYAEGIRGSSLSPFEAKRELQADLFAAALLIPKGMVKRAMTKLGDTQKAAHFFGVSEAALVTRLEQISDSGNGPHNFLAAEHQLQAASGEAVIHKKASETAQAIKSYQDKNAKLASGNPAKPESENRAAGLVSEVKNLPGRLTRGGMDRIREIAKLMEKPNPPKR